MNIVRRVFPGISEVEEGHAAFLNIGRWHWRNLSDILEAEVYCGRPIRWKRGPGFWDATFEVVGPPEHVCQVEERTNSWLVAVGALDGDSHEA